jgi:hypothetical protein
LEEFYKKNSIRLEGRRFMRVAIVDPC